ncbi:cation:proton antiporter [Dongshaea marina]|uniref:cation:proton antiporter n=1 Tax=Dongshaea marina TaxID=2047966 RepID=UPI000D3E33FB|nr:sodium:proton antiporter [Dongshaea marina]
MHELLVVSLAGIVGIGVVCQWLAWRIRLPAILFLLLAGIIAGPLTGWLQPDKVFGPLLFPLVSISVAIILFEGSLNLKFDELAGVAKVVRRLLSSGVLIILLALTPLAHYLFGFPWDLSLLFASMLVVTGPTVVGSMLQTVRPCAKVANILKWEGILIDPIGAILAVIVFEYIAASGSTGHTLLVFLNSLLVGCGLGSIAGYGLGILLRRHWIPDFLENTTTLGFVLAIYMVSDLIQPESGLLTVTIMGLWLANMKSVHIADILDFKETLSLLLVSGLFVVLAARLDFSQIQQVFWPALLLIALLQLVIRPLKVWVATFGSSLSWSQRLLVGWIGPRGIVAAAVASVFAHHLKELGYQQASLLVPLTFMVIIGTVVLQSITARPLALLLGEAAPPARGFLIIGANPVARTIAKVLSDNGIAIRMTDQSWDNIREARMLNLPCFYGHPVSKHAELHLDLSGLGQVLNLSSHTDFGSLINAHYLGVFGRNKVFTLSIAKLEQSERLELADQYQGDLLFAEGMSFGKLASLISQGASIRTTRITEQFGMGDLYKEYQLVVPLFAQDPAGRLHLFTAANKPQVRAEWQLISLVSERIVRSDGDSETSSSGELE